MARDGRRRRVLNDEVRTASGLNLAAYRQPADADAPRYGEQANVENHPQVTDYVPRRKRVVVATLLAGFSVAAAAQAAVHFAAPIAAALPGKPAAELIARMAGGLTTWTSAVVLLMGAMLARLIYSLRRHRVDDYAGRYRVWRWIVWAAVLASVNSVVQVGEAIAAVCTAGTGLSLTASGVEWSLAPLAVIGGWITVRLAIEVRESRISLCMLLAAAGCYIGSAIAAFGGTLPALGPWSEALLASLPLAGHTIALAGLMVFGRYVVLDVQGLIEHKPRTLPIEKPKKPDPAPAVKLAAVPQAAADHTAGEMSNSAKSAAADEAWESEAEDDSEPGGPKLTKAQRKQLRKQRRAA